MKTENENRKKREGTKKSKRENGMKNWKEKNAERKIYGKSNGKGKGEKCEPS